MDCGEMIEIPLFLIKGLKFKSHENETDLVESVTIRNRSDNV